MRSVWLWLLTIALAACVGGARAQDAGTLERIDAFVAQQVADSGLPGVAIVVLQDNRAPHVRGFGHDGRGKPISGDTPFPIGSLTKSFTALLVRKSVDAGQLDVDAPVQRWLPWFRVADPDASSRITLRHLLNQTSGFSRADGIAPLLGPPPGRSQGGPAPSGGGERSERGGKRSNRASLDELTRGLGSVALNRPVGASFEYSNLNFVLLAAVLEVATGQPWRELVRTRVLEPLAMTHSHVDHAAARRDGMTTVHQIVFGVPRARDSVDLLPAFEPTGGLVASANDMARYLQMLLAGGAAPGAPSGRVVSAAGVAQLLAPASPAAHSTLLSADFDFRYAEGWFVGPFGAATDARWHLGSLTPFAAWMVLMPQTKQAVVVLINANTELPVGGVSAALSRLPIGIVNLLHGQPAPQGLSVRAAYGRFIVIAGIVIALTALLAWRAARARRAWGRVLLACAAVASAGAALAAGLGPSLLWIFAPEAAAVLAALLSLLLAPLAWRALAPRRRP